MLNFEIKQEVIPVIQVNFEEMKQALSSTMEQYKGIIVTEESLSACKTEQKELAGMRTRIDTYRKDKKKELSKPITEFENQCKELISMIEKAEQPIKAGISVFDDKKREEKRQKALEIIKTTVEAHHLKQKFADKLTVLDKYMHLTATVKAVKEDVEQRAFYLIEEQAKEEETIQIIKTTIENENKNIKTQIKYEEFENLVKAGTPIPNIIQRINQMAEKIKAAENPPAPVEEPKEEPKEEQKQVIQEAPAPVREIPCSPTGPANEVKEPIYFIEFRVVGPQEKTLLLGNFLRLNNIAYQVLKQGRAD